MIMASGDRYGRPGLKDTPERFRRAWVEWTSGYAVDPADLLTSFDSIDSATDELVVVGPIRFYSTCEHHLAPFFGQAIFGYVPDARILGLSKFARILDVFARRLQVQERLGQQLADALQENLAPVGLGVLLRARHLCMESRGVKAGGAVTTTSALRGCMRSSPEARAEFLVLARDFGTP